MPKTSRETASHVEDMGVLESRSEQLAGYTVEFTTFREDADGAPMFKGLPDDRCQSRHWGYVLKGRLTFKYADHQETCEAGDAYYGPPGHVPEVTAGTEVVEFSPAEEYRRTLEVIARNFAALQG
jgi:mannose-6-phosphate isomerase-like protein (cupin superfamily)